MKGDNQKRKQPETHSCKLYRSTVSTLAIETEKTGVPAWMRTNASSCRYLPLKRAKSVLEEIDLPASSFSTDFARAVFFVNECYKKYTSLIMNTEYPAFHPNGNRNGSFCQPRPIQKRKQKRKK